MFQLFQGNCVSYMVSNKKSDNKVTASIWMQPVTKSKLISEGFFPMIKWKSVNFENSVRNNWRENCSPLIKSAIYFEVEIKNPGIFGVNSLKYLGINCPAINFGMTDKFFFRRNLFHKMNCVHKIHKT